MKWLIYAEPYGCPACSNKIVRTHIALNKDDALDYIQKHKADRYNCKTPNCNICDGSYYIFRLAKIKKEILGE